MSLVAALILTTMGPAPQAGAASWWFKGCQFHGYRTSVFYDGAYRPRVITDGRSSCVQGTYLRMPYKVDGVWYYLNTSQPYYPYNAYLTLTLWNYTTGSVDDYRGNHKILTSNVWSDLKVT